jgi:hypothetical protein
MGGSHPERTKEDQDGQKAEHYLVSDMPPWMPSSRWF